MCASRFVPIAKHWPAMHRRNLALDDATTERLRELGNFYETTHSAVARLAIADLALRVRQAQTGDRPMLGGSASRASSQQSRLSRGPTSSA